MAQTSARGRVLIVDDMPELRVMTSRVLSGSGFEVDVAATLQEARTLELHDYDALLVDARLGDDSGVDLVEELVADDQAAAARCVIMTGGSWQRFPAGVAVLVKPFDQGKLVDTVRAAVAGKAAAATSLPDRPTPAAGSWPASAHVPDPARSWHFAELLARCRSYDYGTMADFVHDGPAQDLSAAILAVALIGHSPGEVAADRLGELDALLSSAARSLRDFTDRRLACLSGQLSLAEALTAQTAHLLPEPLTVELAGVAAWPGPALTAALCTMIELLLDAVAGRRPAASVTVRRDESAITVDLNLALSSAFGDQGCSEPDTAFAALAELAAAMGGHAEACSDDQHWRARVTLAAD